MPAIVTAAPTAPEAGDRLVTLGGGITVNGNPMLVNPFAVTTTGPVVAPLGTSAQMDVSVQLLIVAATPLKVAEPWVSPKLIPVIVISVPTPAEAGERLVMPGRGGVVTVNVTPLLCTPFADMTVTGPVVAAGTCTEMDVSVQLLIGALGDPANLTDPLVVPKFLPVIVTDVPTAPEVGERLVMVGEVGVVTVNVTPLESCCGHNHRPCRRSRGHLHGNGARRPVGDRRRSRSVELHRAPRRAEVRSANRDRSSHAAVGRCQADYLGVYGPQGRGKQQGG